VRKATAHLKKADPVLGSIIERAGPFRIQYRDPDFSSLARAIVFQQLNGKAAGTIFERFLALTGGRLTPQAVLRIPPAKLRKAGLSAQKASYLRDLARQTAGGAIRFDRLASMPDEEVIQILTQVKGVGVWTAHMFLIFGLRRPDVLASGDYGVRAAVKKAYALEELPAPAEVERMGARWRPWASVACWYLWRSLEFR